MENNPDFAMIVHVEEAFHHCGKAMIWTDLWEPAKAVLGEVLPTYGRQGEGAALRLRQLY